MKQKGRPYARHVLYVDLPQGQVSFHSRVKYDGPEYGGDWDGKYKSEERIVEFADAVVARSEQAPPVARRTRWASLETNRSCLTPAKFFVAGEKPFPM